MDTLMICCLLVLLPHCAFGDGAVEYEYGLHSQDETIERLNKIEAVLESVLEKNNRLERKNDELERRIEALEEETRRLNTLVSKKEEQDMPSNNVKDDITDTAEDVDGEASPPLNKDDTTNTAEDVDDVASPALPSGKTNIINLRKRANRVPRLLLSGLGIGQTIVYDHVITNVGGAYHNTTGIFTAPVSGVYVFNFDTMLDPGKSQYLTLVMDGHSILFSYIQGVGETHYMTSSRTGTVRVRAGSELWVKTFETNWHGDGTIHGGEYSAFSGWLLALTE